MANNINLSNLFNYYRFFLSISLSRLFFNLFDDSSIDSIHNLNSDDNSGFFEPGSTFSIISDTDTVFKFVTLCLLNTIARTKLSDKVTNSCSR